MRRAPALAAALLACAPPPDFDPTQITSPRLVSVRADPPEAAPGERVRLDALVAAPAGSPAGVVRWAVCLRARAPTDPTVVPAGCDEGATALGLEGEAVETTLPAEACRVAGPEAPAGTRAPDPDGTGGYYLTYRVTLDTADDRDLAFARVRLRCVRPDLPTDLARALATRDARNRNPEIAAVALAPDGTVTARAGEAERYARVSPRGDAWIEETEALEAWWFTDVGALRSPRAAVTDGRATGALARDGARGGSLWVVVRDGRGGVAHGRWAVPP